MSLFNSISRGFGLGLGAQAARKVTSSSVDSLWKATWGFVKWCLIITFLVGFLQGFFGESKSKTTVSTHQSVKK
jgi:hypothetical protein